MPELLLASNNQGKLQEILALLSGISIEILTPEQIDLELSVPEDGATYKDNAQIKARSFSAASGLISLADDSGLEVDALDGLPGLRSARFSNIENATDSHRRQFLLKLLSNKPRPWTASFRSVVALAEPGGEIHFTEGTCEGEIIPNERGRFGFGYDPIFFFPELGKTMAELPMAEKNKISHRAKAVTAAIPTLLYLFH